MEDVYLRARLDTLRAAQNTDGGWGYFPGKQSWLEPTAFAALALHGSPAAERAWQLIVSWQNHDGGVRPAAEVNVSSWATSVCVTLALARGEEGNFFDKATAWLLGMSGVENNWVNRAASAVGLLDAERNLKWQGWPWKPETTSWVEPTAHALVALKRAAPKFSSGRSRERIQLGEGQLLDVRCSDGGWNYGSRAALKIDLPSYPETTALALLGLQGRSGLDRSLGLAETMMRNVNGRLARAWLAIGLRLHGRTSVVASLPPVKDTLITAIEAIGAPRGNFHLLKAGGPA